MNKTNYPRVLIVGTVPYNRNTSARAFDAYFHRWERESIRQIFSNTKIPTKGHCGSLYQITDQRLVRRWLGRITEVGMEYLYEELPDDWTDNSLEVQSKLFDWLYKIGSKESPFKHLARWELWKKKYWCTDKLNRWLDDFKPECVFLAFSDDFFIPTIALYVARRFDIPIMSCIGDDYYFNDKKTLSPLYHIYRKHYKKLIDDVFKHGGSAIYIGDKIKDKYNSYFGLTGETVYLTSNIKRHPFRVINVSRPKISYCGNIRLGRNTSLVDMAEALGTIDDSYRLDVYSSEKNKEYIMPLKKCKYIQFHGPVPYREVEKIMSNSDMVVIVEGFKPKDVNKTKYSLSTKAADALATGSQIFVYGSMNCGVVEYMASSHGAVVCTSKEELVQRLYSLINDITLQKELYDKSSMFYEWNHDADKNVLRSEKLFDKMIEDYEK